MSAEFHSKQEIFDGLGPEISPAEAKDRVPVAGAEFAERTRDRERAEAECARLKGVCDENMQVLKFLAAVESTLTAQVNELRGKLRPELYALREAYAFEENASLLRKKLDAMEHATTEYDHILTVKYGADEILHLDSVVNLRLAEHQEISAAAVLSRTQSIAALGPIMESEGGAVGLIGGRTEALREQANAAWKRYEAARTQAHEARQKYEKMQSARIARGVITSANVSHSIARY